MTLSLQSPLQNTGSAILQPARGRLARLPPSHRRGPWCGSICNELCCRRPRKVRCSSGPPSTSVRGALSGGGAHLLALSLSPCFCLRSGCEARPLRLRWSGRRGDVPGGAGRPVVARLARMRVRSRAPRCRRSRAPDESSPKVRNQIRVWLEQFSVFLSPKFRIGGGMRDGLELLLPARDMSCTHNFWSIHVLAH